MKKYLLPLLLCLCCLFPCLALAAEADTAVPGADIVATIIGCRKAGDSGSLSS